MLAMIAEGASDLQGSEARGRIGASLGLEKPVAAATPQNALRRLADKKILLPGSTEATINSKTRRLPIGSAIGNEDSPKILFSAAMICPSGPDGHHQTLARLMSGAIRGSETCENC
ncbi:hypothetical protein ACFS07_28470 [Undibacterium arcticum]